MGKLETIRNSSDGSRAKAANDILNKVHSYRNRLLEDEAKVVRSLGIKVTIDPMQVSYYKRSGGVSVRWQARVRDIDSKIRCAFLIPPNDSRKQAILYAWLSKQSPRDVERVEREILGEGHTILQV
jgi:hypothetical protein